MNFRSSFAALLALSALAAPAAAEISEAEGWCIQGNQIGSCGDYRISMKPPAGWHGDEAESKRRGVQLFIPDGKVFGDAPALIYAKIRPNTSGADLEAWLKASNARWTGAHPDARIDRVKEVAGRSGIGLVVVERYTTPSLKNQPVEMSATFAESDAKGNPFVVQVVLSGLGEKAVTAAEPAFLAMIRAYAE